MTRKIIATKCYLFNCLWLIYLNDESINQEYISSDFGLFWRTNLRFEHFCLKTFTANAVTIKRTRSVIITIMAVLFWFWLWFSVCFWFWVWFWVLVWFWFGASWMVLFSTFFYEEYEILKWLWIVFIYSVKQSAFMIRIPTEILQEL